MTRSIRTRLAASLAVLATLAAARDGSAQSSANSGSAHASYSSGGSGRSVGFGVSGGGWGNTIVYNPTLFPIWTPYGPGVLLPPPLIVVAPGGGFPVPAPYPVAPLPTGFGQGGGLQLPLPPRELDDAPIVARPQVRRVSLTRVEELVTMGERLFRAKNYKKSEERFEQAADANPNSARPHVLLAQIALTRGDYKRAAGHFRDAHTAEPNWLVGATDIMALYTEPADFHKRIEVLESHVRVNPADRDAWLVLGAEKFLTGKVRESSDIFRRLNDRRADPTLAGFLDATTPDPPRP